MAILDFTTDQQQMILGSAALHLSCFYTVKTLVPYIGRDRKRLSWVLTTFTALVVSVLSAYVLYTTSRTYFHATIPYSRYEMTPTSGGFYRYDVTFQPRLRSTLEQDSVDRHQEMVSFYQSYDQATVAKSSFWPHRLVMDSRFTPSDSLVGQAAVVFFLMYLVCDLALSLLHYREQVSFLTGWFHHCLYMAISIHTLKVRDSNLFASYLIIEVPTFFMGLGHLYKPLRHDMVFGGLFIAFRIVFDFALTHELVKNRPEMGGVTRAFQLFKSAMHAKFLVDWISQQRRLRRKAAKEADVAARAAKASVAVAPRVALTKAPTVGVDKDLNGMTAMVAQTIQKNEHRREGQQKIVGLGYDDVLHTKERVTTVEAETPWSSLRNARRRNTSNMRDTLEEALQDMVVAH
ncbi:hypothetical protein BG005_007935 [Podila minutissima]|nr:hypothetical protein BG005_007935 [Podila minutissima]